MDPVPGAFALGECSRLATFLRAFPNRLAENPHFYSLFCDFSLRSLGSLAIVPNGPSFSAAKQGFFARGLPHGSGWNVNTGG
jgi:hypothetical protein